MFIFIHSLFLIGNWNSLDIHQLIMKILYIYTAKYSSGIKKKQIMKLAGNWMKVKSTILNNVIKIQKDKYCMFSLMLAFKV